MPRVDLGARASGSRRQLTLLVRRDQPVVRAAEHEDGRGDRPEHVSQVDGPIGLDLPVRSRLDHRVQGLDQLFVALGGGLLPVTRAERHQREHPGEGPAFEQVEPVAELGVLPCVGDRPRGVQDRFPDAIRAGAGQVGRDDPAEGVADDAGRDDPRVVQDGFGLGGEVLDGDRAAVVGGQAGAGEVRGQDGVVPGFCRQRPPLLAGGGGAVQQEQGGAVAGPVVVDDGVFVRHLRHGRLLQAARRVAANMAGTTVRSAAVKARGASWCGMCPLPAMTCTTAPGVRAAHSRGTSRGISVSSSPCR